MEIRIEEVNSIVLNIFGECATNIICCSNKALNRNQVYKFDANNKTWIIKFYYKPFKRIRESETLLKYYQSKLKLSYLGATKISEFDAKEIEWSMYEFISGDLMDDIYERLDKKDRISIVYDIGKEMGTFHSCSSFDYFGDWVSIKQSPIDQYKKFIISDTERLINNILADQSIDINGEDKYILRAIEALRREYVNIRVLSEGRLCHRDLDGRNILITQDYQRTYHLEAFLDFEKCVVFNEYYDIMGLYRKYFFEEPYLIHPFIKGYNESFPLKDDFISEFNFNILRISIELFSWSKNVSLDFFDEIKAFVVTIIENPDKMEKIKEITVSEILKSRSNQSV